MIRRLLAALLSLTCVACGHGVDYGFRGVYPQAKRGPQVDVLHGVRVPDPYRWLERENAPNVRKWIAAENKLTFSYLRGITARESIRRHMTALWNYPRVGVPLARAGRFFMTRNDGLQNQDVLYVSRDLGERGEVLLDPNRFAADGTHAVKSYRVSPKGRYLAYTVSKAGSDWVTIRVMDIATKKTLPDALRWVKFSRPAWDKAGEGFYYSRYLAPPKPGKKLTAVNTNQRLYYHRIGTPQSQDVLVYERPNEPKWGYGAHVTHDGAYLLISVWQGTSRNNGLFYQRLDKTGSRQGEVVRLLSRFDASYRFIANDGPIFYVQTDLDAPRGRVVAIDVRKPGRAHWKTVVPQTKDTLRYGVHVGAKMALAYLRDARSVVRIYSLAGKAEGMVPLPTLGSIYALKGLPDDPMLYFGFSSFTFPATVYRYDVRDRSMKVISRPPIAKGLEKYVVKQVFYRSKDGTRVPMFIAHRRGLRLDGTTPTYLYGYGGFNIAITPYYSTVNRVWLDLGGVYAVANIRGGGEYGREWHLAGTKLKKQNVFDDFIAAAEWLIAKRYTSSSKLAIGGGSNGGLLVAACITQRPKLFGGALVRVGVLDMLRFHKYTIGWAWTSDYGSPDNPREFKALHAYSPYHNLRKGTAYPPTLIMTADHDDRVVPAHSFKFAAALQAAQGGPGPVLIRIDTKAGHGAGKPTTKRIAAATDMLAFMVRVLGVQVPAVFSKTRAPAKR